MVQEPFGNASVAFGSSGDGEYSIDQQIDNEGNIVRDRDKLLFKVESSSGDMFLEDTRFHQFRDPKGIVRYTCRLRAEAVSGIIVVSVVDVNEGGA